MKIIIPGGSSYIGSRLVPQLLTEGHEVTVYDTLVFGDGFLPANANLTLVKADVRDAHSWRSACQGKEAVIYLAGISREITHRQQPSLTHAINVGCFSTNVSIAKQEGVKRFIFASSVAVYGNSETPSVESSPLIPVSLYGKGKKSCEEELWAYGSSEFTVAATRSGSVCGYAPRMRFDLTLNKMTHDAFRFGAITVENANQKRSHVHIQDLCDLYALLLSAPKETIEGAAFNVASENQTLLESAQMVASAIGNTTVSFTNLTEHFSFPVDGSKVKTLGFDYGKSLSDAVNEVWLKFDSGYWMDSLTNPLYKNMVDYV